MGFATHLGPWLLGTVKNTTGTVAGTIRNTGAAIVMQKATLAFNALTGTAFVLPAGAQITSVTVVTTTVFSAATTLSLSIGGTLFTEVKAITAVGSTTLAANTATPDAWLNVGTTDAIVEYAKIGATLTTGNATVYITYAVLNSDNTAFPASA
jgi:hypothetical protein